jgi:hypothetical protein
MYSGYCSTTSLGPRQVGRKGWASSGPHLKPTWRILVGGLPLHQIPTCACDRVQERIARLDAWRVMIGHQMSVVQSAWFAPGLHPFCSSSAPRMPISATQTLVYLRLRDAWFFLPPPSGTVARKFRC